MRVEATKIFDRIQKVAGEKGMRDIFKTERNRMIAGYVGQFTFYQYRYGDWKRALKHIPIGEADKFDIKINDLNVNIKTTEPSFVIPYSPNFGLQIPIQQLRKYDAYVDIIIAENIAHILGFILDSELDKYQVRKDIQNPAKVVLRERLHPIEDLFSKPIRVDRTLADILPEETRKMFERFYQGRLLRFPQIERLIPTD